MLSLDTEGAPLLNVFGGKITTYRRLAEGAMDRIAPTFPSMPGRWTAGVPLPGGDFAVGEVGGLIARLGADYPFLTPASARRLVRAYGTDAWRVLGDAREAAALGPDFGAGLTAREVDWLMAREFARTAADVLWRRSKLGLRIPPEGVEELDAYMAEALRIRAAAE